MIYFFQASLSFTIRLQLSSLRPCAQMLGQYGRPWRSFLRWSSTSRIAILRIQHTCSTIISSISIAPARSQCNYWWPNYSSACNNSSGNWRGWNTTAGLKFAWQILILWHARWISTATYVGMVVWNHCCGMCSPCLCICQPLPPFIHPSLHLIDFFLEIFNFLNIPLVNLINT